MSKKRSAWEGDWGRGFGKKCAHSHPPLKIPVGDKVYEIEGGSCTSPGKSLDGYDVFVGFDQGMEQTKPLYPWSEDRDHFLFYIRDMSVPSSLKEFKNLLNYLQASLEAGKRVFIGCIGGHGRTGLVLAALYTQMTGEKDSIKLVRKQYCDRAVESAEQVNWLNKHFGIKKNSASKSFGGRSGQKSLGFDGDWGVSNYSVASATSSRRSGGIVRPEDELLINTMNPSYALAKKS